MYKYKKGLAGEETKLHQEIESVEQTCKIGSFHSESINSSIYIKNEREVGFFFIQLNAQAKNVVCRTQ